jgi:macrolide-specific efflux system membrane fusion protein
MKLKLLVVVLLLVVGAGATIVALGGLPTGAAAASSFLTTPVSRSTVTEDAAATGTIEPSRSYGLAFGSRAHLIAEDSSDPGAGRTWHVTEVGVEVGDAVTAGQVLARADTTDVEAELADAANAVAAARAQVAIAEERLEDADDADSRRLARIDVYNARTQESQARQTVKTLKAELAAATLRAPIDGIISALDVGAGLDAPSGDALVVQATDYIVQADVVESDLPSVRLDLPASVTVDAVDAELEGRVTAIAPTASESEAGVVSYAVTIAVADPPADIRPGMTADVTITLAEAADVLAVPTSALLGSEGEYVARVLAADGTVELRPVTTGLVTNTMAEITDGLSEGETIVTGTSNAQDPAQQGQGGPRGGIGIPGDGPIIRDGPVEEVRP